MDHGDNSMKITLRELKVIIREEIKASNRNLNEEEGVKKINITNELDDPEIADVSEDEHLMEQLRRILLRRAKRHV